MLNHVLDLLVFSVERTDPLLRCINLALQAREAMAMSALDDRDAMSAQNLDESTESHAQALSSLACINMICFEIDPSQELPYKLTPPPTRLFLQHQGSLQHRAA